MVLCIKQWLIRFRVVSSMYLQNFKFWNLTEPELQANFYDHSKQEINFVKSLSVILLCAYDALQRLFAMSKSSTCKTMRLHKTFCMCRFIIELATFGKVFGRIIDYLPLYGKTCLHNN